MSDWTKTRSRIMAEAQKNAAGASDDDLHHYGARTRLGSAQEWPLIRDRVWNVLGEARMAVLKGDREEALAALDRARRVIYGEAG